LDAAVVDTRAQSRLAVAIGIPWRSVAVLWESEVRWASGSPPFPEPMCDGSLWRVRQVSVLWVGLLGNCAALVLVMATCWVLYVAAERWSRSDASRRAKFELLVPTALREPQTRVSWVALVWFSTWIVFLVLFLMDGSGFHWLMRGPLLAVWAAIYMQGRLDPGSHWRERMPWPQPVAGTESAGTTNPGP